MALAMLISTNVATFAGGILTNTNQSVLFLRNPARDGAIGLDGVYSNPAGVLFLGEGFHLGFNWQYARQTRTITSQNPLYTLGYKNDNLADKIFKGVANAPFIPSLQAAYNTGDWSFQFNFSVPGGGGKCEFDHGVGTFEKAVGAIAQRLIGVSSTLNEQLKPLGASVPSVTGYDMDAYMKGQQFYFGFQIGAARKINDNLSVYGGLRLLYGTAAYEARMNNIRVMDGQNGISLPQYFEGVINGIVNARTNISGNQQKVQAGIQQYVNAYMAAGMTQEQAMQMPEVQQLTATSQQLQDADTKLKAAGDEITSSAEALAPYANGMNLKSDQSGWGIAPVIGIDYKIGNLNLAAKYEFKTRMRMKNNSTLEEASVVAATNKYIDGTSVPEDAPALLALGAQWSVTDAVRLNLGYHHFFDKSAHWYQHSEKDLDSETNEYLAGAEWDITKRLQVSGGAQLTRYGLSDKFMNDMSFVVNSWTFGLGIGYQVTDNVKINAAYFQTNYDNYDMDTPAQSIAGMGLEIPAGHDSFTRTNKVIGLGVEITL